MRALIALFIWIGIPLILISALDLQGGIWKFLLCGVFGVAALFYYGLTSK
jgi:hypothetical protein